MCQTKMAICQQFCVHHMFTQCIIVYMYQKINVSHITTSCRLQIKKRLVFKECCMICEVVTYIEMTAALNSNGV